MYPPNIVKQLITKHVNLRLSAGYTPAALKQFAQLAVTKNVELAIDCSGITAAVAKEIAVIGGSNITLIF